MNPHRRVWSLLPARVRTPLSVFGRAFHLYFEDNCQTYAAAIAYYAIFSLVPLSLVTLSVFGLVVERDRIVQFVFDQVPLEQTASVQDSVDTLVRRTQQASIVSLAFGVLLLTWSASGIFSAVRTGLNVASHRRGTRPYWRSKLVDFALIPLLGVLILLSIGMTAVAQFAIERAGDLGPLTANRALIATSFVVPAIVSFILFLLLYRLVPAVRPRWPESIAGACFATILFEGAKNLYAGVIAVTPYSTDTALYAGFGTALIFLFWMFINASILLLGAEFVRAVAFEKAGHAAPPAPVSVAPMPLVPPDASPQRRP